MSIRSSSGSISMALRALAAPSCTKRAIRAARQRQRTRRAGAPPPRLPSPGNPLDIQLLLNAASGAVVLQQGKQIVVLPDTVDLEIAARAPLARKSGFFQDARGGNIMRQTGGLEPMQSQHVEGERQHGTHGLGHVAPLRVRQADPVADRGGLGDAAPDVTDGQTTK